MSQRYWIKLLGGDILRGNETKIPSGHSVIVIDSLPRLHLGDDILCARLLIKIIKHHIKSPKKFKRRTIVVLMKFLHQQHKASIYAP